VTSEARTRPRDDEEAPAADAVAATASDGVPDEGATDRSATDDEAIGDGRRRGRPGTGNDEGPVTRSRLSLPLVPALSVLLVLLLAGAAFLWFTRPGPSAVRTGDYVSALQAARSGVVDMTSFDYLTLDDDIEQIRRVTTGDLRDQAVDRLDSQRQVLTGAKTVVNTEVVTAGVTRADDSDATVLLVIQSTQESSASPQAQVGKYRIQVELKKIDGRWLLSGISGR
jgi:hypothetical protein